MEHVARERDEALTRHASALGARSHLNDHHHAAPREERADRALDDDGGVEALGWAHWAANLRALLLLKFPGAFPPPYI